MGEKSKMEMLEDCIAQITLNMQTNEIMIPIQLNEHLKKFGDPQEILIEIIQKAIDRYQ